MTDNDPKKEAAKNHGEYDNLGIGARAKNLRKILKKSFSRPINKT